MRFKDLKFMYKIVLKSYVDKIVLKIGNGDLVGLVKGWDLDYLLLLGHRGCEGWDM